MRRATSTSRATTRPTTFLSTLSLRRATTRQPTKRPQQPNFYPRSPCGERRDFWSKPAVVITISIHALLAESDCASNARNERRTEFLSTLSLRRATAGPGQRQAESRHFYPRSPCGERPMQIQLDGAALQISIHALLAESDLNKMRHNRLKPRHFYPRSPCGERRPPAPPRRKSYKISIHALLAESDVVDTVEFASSVLFLSTLSLRRATGKIWSTAFAA